MVNDDKDGRRSMGIYLVKLKRYAYVHVMWLNLLLILRERHEKNTQKNAITMRKQSLFSFRYMDSINITLLPRSEIGLIRNIPTLKSLSSGI